MAQIVDTKEKLSKDDQSLVKRVENLFKEADAKTGLINRIKGLVPGHSNKAGLANRFDWSHAKKTSDGVRVPGLPEGRADALIVTSKDLNRVGAKITPVGADNLMAFGNISDNLLSLVDPKEFLSRMKATNKLTEGIPKSKTGIEIFEPLKPVTRRGIADLYTATAAHEVCHLDNDQINLMSNKNSEVACYGQTLSELSKKGEFAAKSPDQIMNFIIGAYDQITWGREIIIFTDGKFDKKTREILPGGKNFNASLEDWIALAEFELKSLTDKDMREQREIAILHFKDAIEHPTGCYYTKVLLGMMDAQLAKEFDAKNPTITSSEERDRYVDKRMDEFLAYMNGDRETFELDKFRSPPRKFPKK